MLLLLEGRGDRLPPVRPQVVTAQQRELRPLEGNEDRRPLEPLQVVMAPLLLVPQPAARGDRLLPAPHQVILVQQLELLQDVREDKRLLELHPLATEVRPPVRLLQAVKDAKPLLVQPQGM